MDHFWHTHTLQTFFGKRIVLALWQKNCKESIRQISLGEDIPYLGCHHQVGPFMHSHSLNLSIVTSFLTEAWANGSWFSYALELWKRRIIVYGRLIREKALSDCKEIYLWVGFIRLHYLANEMILFVKEFCQISLFKNWLRFNFVLGCFFKSFRRVIYHLRAS